MRIYVPCAVHTTTITVRRASPTRRSQQCTPVVRTPVRRREHKDFLHGLAPTDKGNTCKRPAAAVPMSLQQHVRIREPVCASGTVIVLSRRAKTSTRPRLRRRPRVQYRRSIGRHRSAARCGWLVRTSSALLGTPRIDPSMRAHNRRAAADCGPCKHIRA